MPRAPGLPVTNALIRLPLPIIIPVRRTIHLLGGEIRALLIGVEGDGFRAGADAPVEADVVGGGGELDAAPALGQLVDGGWGRDEGFQRAGGVGEGADGGLPAFELFGPVFGAGAGGEVGCGVGGGVWEGRGGGGEGGGEGGGAQREEEEGGGVHVGSVFSRWDGERGVCVFLFVCFNSVRRV